MELGRVSKESVIRVCEDLWWRGEMLKAQEYINNCVPIMLQGDIDIISIKNKVNDRITEIKSWSTNGRPDRDDHAYVYDINSFPKYLKAIDIIKESNYKTILDIGTYTGGLIDYLAKIGYECTGIDVHKGLMQDLDERYGGNPKFMFGIAAELDKYFLPQSFDVVILFDVLEHCLEDEPVIIKVNEVVKPGGLVIINLPKSTLDYVDEALEHVRMYNETDIVRLFGDNKNFKLDTCLDELGRDTFFITYNA